MNGLEFVVDELDEKRTVTIRRLHQGLHNGSTIGRARELSLKPLKPREDGTRYLRILLDLFGPRRELGQPTV